MLRWTVHLRGALLPQMIQGATAVAVGQKVYSFLGSYDSSDAAEHSFQVEVHVFHTATLRWTRLPPAAAGLGGAGGGGGERPPEAPSSMCRGHGAAAAIDEVIYVWGRSWRTDYYDALYAYDARAHRWHRPRVTGTVPEARDAHSSCALGRALYIYGGYTRWTGRTDSIYRLHTPTMVWSLVGAGGTPPAASEAQSATVIGSRMFVFGFGFGYVNNIRVFDTETDRWLSDGPRPSPAPPEDAASVLPPPPEAWRRRGPVPLGPLPGDRRGHAAFAYNGELYIFGGGGEPACNDLWKFNPDTFSWRKAEPIGGGGGGPPRSQASGMRCCVVGGARVVLFGGGGGGAGAGGGDLFVLDLSPSLKTLCKLALIRDGRAGRGVPHCVRWELTAMLDDGPKRRSNAVY